MNINKFLASQIMLLVFLLLTPLALAQDPGHSAFAVGPGSFSAGNYVFPNNVSVTERVGIGTSTPAKPLHLYGNTSSGIRIQDSTFPSGYTDLYQETDSYNFYIRNSGGDKFGFTGSGISFVPSSASDIWLGTDSDSYVYGSDVAGGSLYLQSTSHANKGNISLNPEGGNVGIGTISPSVPLDVYGAPVSGGLAKFRSNSDTRNAIVIYNSAYYNQLGVFASTNTYYSGANSGFVASEAGLSLVSQGANDNMTFATAGSLNSGANERMRITSTGNVGIGTKTPSELLSVKNATADSVPRISLANDVMGVIMQVNGQDTDKIQLLDTLDSNTFLERTRAVRTQIGVQADELVLRGSVIANEVGDDKDFRIESDTDTNNFFSDGGTNRVGIGTGTPTHKLNVVGDANITGDLYVQGTSNLGSITITADNITTNNIKSKDGNITFYNNANDKNMIITSDGKVGIGTANPQRQLDVASQIRGRNDIEVYNTVRFYGSSAFNNYSSIFAVGDTNNVSLRFSTKPYNGVLTERMIIDGAGNVGIGTTTPGYKLDIIADGGGININSSDGSNAPFIKFSHDSNSGDAHMWQLRSINADKFQLYDQSNNQAIWTGYNNLLGIGLGLTENPTHTLTVKGSANITGDLYVQGTSNLGSITISADNITTNNIKSKDGNISFYNTSSGKNMIITNAGYVGIGTTNPGYPFNLVSTIGGRFFELEYAGGAKLGNYQDNGQAAWGSVSNHPFNLQAVGVTLITLTTDAKVGVGTTVPTHLFTVNGDVNLNNTLYVNKSTGNVGIGTTTPAARLQVEDNANTLAVFKRPVSGVAMTVANIGTNTQSWNFGLTDGSGFGISDVNTGLTKLYIQNNTGNVGIGTTTPNEKLVIADSVNAWAYAKFQPSDSNHWAIGADGYGFAVYDMDPTTKLRMVIDQNGNVGINTTTTTYKLNVVGSANITGDLYVQGTSNLGSITITADNITTNNIKSKDGNITFSNSSGSEKMRILSNGNVGIGTTSPDAKLQVSGGGGQDTILAKGTAYPLIVVEDTASGVRVKMQSTPSDYAYIGTETASNLKFITSNDAKMTILDSSGNVGIGTLTPVEKLNVIGSINATGNISAGDYLCIRGDCRETWPSYAGETQSLQDVTDIGNETTHGIQVGGLSSTGPVDLNNTLYVLAEGKVGIGINNPTYKLVVKGGNEDQLRLDNSNNGDNVGLFFAHNGADKWEIRSQGGTPHDLMFYSYDAGAYVFNIKGANGYVGINTTNPTHALNVIGSANITGDLYVQGTSNLGSITITADNITTNNIKSKDGNITFYDNTGDKNMIITNAGNVGIGTATPTHKLNVIGDANITGTIIGDKANFSGLVQAETIYGNLAGVYSATGFYLGAPLTSTSSIVEDGGIAYNAKTGEKHIWRINNAAKMILDTNGNVGIGTTTPQAKLEVNGGVRLNTTASKPTCDLNQRGTMWVQQDYSGTEDVLWTCMKNSSASYNWIMVARGG